MEWIGKRKGIGGGEGDGPGREREAALAAGKAGALATAKGVEAASAVEQEQVMAFLAGAAKGVAWGREDPGGGGGRGGGLAHPRYGENPKPKYPSEACKRGHQGEVLLLVEVLPDGKVGEIEVAESSGYELLDQSALDAVKRWKFIPAKKESIAIPCWVKIPILFKLL